MSAAEISATDERHLRRALELARRGEGAVSPNPLVGAVIAKAEEVLGEGWHAELGGAHAEAAALADARSRGADVAGATAYVTLEPCAHTGRQPPCAPALVEAGISRVVIASDDPTEKAGGAGPGILADAGVAVAWAGEELAAAARELNQPFRKVARTGRAHVVLKSAQTLDGRTATASGDSRWISGEQSRALVHRWRAAADGVCVGIGTVLADDPHLIARDVEVRRQPARIVFDPGARLPPDSRLLATVSDSRLILFCRADADVDRVKAIADAGAEVIELSGRGPDAIAPALAELAQRDVCSVLLEGGPALAGSFFDAGEIDELRLFVAPLVFGGAGAGGVIGGGGAADVADGLRPTAARWERSGEDMLAIARLREW